MILIDTDVLVECLRGSTVAKTWLGTLRKDTFAIPGVVAMELLMGCRIAHKVSAADQGRVAMGVRVYCPRYSPLFQPQCLHGINPRCPPRRQKRGRRAYAQHDREYNREGQRIAGLHAIQNSLQQSSGA